MIMITRNMRWYEKEGREEQQDTLLLADDNQLVYLAHKIKLLI